MLFIMICTYQCSQLLNKWPPAAKVIKPNQVSIAIGLTAGIIAMLRYSSSSLEELRKEQAFLFKVFLVPPILYEMYAYSSANG